MRFHLLISCHVPKSYHHLYNVICISNFMKKKNVSGFLADKDCKLLTDIK